MKRSRLYNLDHMDFFPSQDPPPPQSVLWFAIPAGTVIVAVAIGLMFVNDDSKASTLTGTSYDASNSGYRALYTILEELGYSIERTRRVAGGSVRWALAPLKPKESDADHVKEWVSKGGRLLLADAKGELAGTLGIRVEVSEIANPALIPTTINDAKQIAPGKTLLKPLNEAARKWHEAGDEPLVTIHQVGAGEVWLLHRPLSLTNGQMRQADNPVFAARLAEAMSDGKPGLIGVDEYCHGLRARPGVIELLFQAPIRTAAIQFIFFVGILLWGAAIRFGPVRPLPPPRRRSKEEFLNALAELLHRQGDTASAFRTIQGEVVHQLAERIGMPTGTHPEDVVEAASRRHPIKPALAHLLTCAAPPPGRAAFVNSIHTLDEASHELTRR